MKYCPKCRSEYESRVSACADCKVELVDQLPPSPALDPQPKMVVLCREPLPSAQIIVAGLNSRGIPADIDDEISALTAPHFFGGTDGVKITVPQEFAEEAQNALDEFRQHVCRIEEDDEPDSEQGGKGE